MKALEIFKSAALPQAILDRALAVPAEAIKKVDHIASMINLINSEAKKIKSEEATLAAKRKTLELLVEMAESSIKEEMGAEGMCELQGEMIKYSLSTSPPRLIIDDQLLIPKEYMRETVVVEIRKDAIKDQLKLGDVIPGARLEYGTTLKLSAVKD